MDQVILVTGANGFVGRNVINHFSSRPGIRIVATDIHETRNAMHKHTDSDVTYLSGDISNASFVAELAAHCTFDTIIHLAAVISQSSDPQTYISIMDSNIRATFLLLEMVKSQKVRVIFPSTALVYGSQAGPFREEMLTEPGDFYALSKLTSEQLIGFYGRRYDVRSVIFRIGILYGPSQMGGMFIPSLIASLLGGKDFPMTKGEQSRDFVFINDLIAMMEAALDRPDVIGTFNVGTGVPSKLCDVALLAERLIGRSGLVQLGAIPYRQKESWEYCLDSGKVRQALGKSPTTSLKEGLTRTIEFERQRSIA